MSTSPTITYVKGETVLFQWCPKRLTWIHSGATVPAAGRIELRVTAGASGE